MGFDTASERCTGVKDSQDLFSVAISAANPLHDPEDLTPRLCCGAPCVCGMEGTTFLLCLPSFIMQDFRGQSLINQGTYLSKGLVLSVLIGISTDLIVRTNKKMTASEMAPIALQSINLRLSWS